MAHTPGPWRINISMDVISQVEGGNILIAQIKQHYVGPLRNQWRDNARLIAAAPSLLAACEAVYEWARQSGVGDDVPEVDDWDEALEQVTAALRAAGSASVDRAWTRKKSYGLP